MKQNANVKSCTGPRLMSFLKVVAFVLVERKDEQTVNQVFHQAIDGLVIRRLPIFDSGLESIVVEDVENADEILQEISESREDG